MLIKERLALSLCLKMCAAQSAETAPRHPLPSLGCTGESVRRATQCCFPTHKMAPQGTES